MENMSGSLLPFRAGKFRYVKYGNGVLADTMIKDGLNDSTIHHMSGITVERLLNVSGGITREDQTHSKTVPVKACRKRKLSRAAIQIPDRSGMVHRRNRIVTDTDESKARPWKRR